MAVFHSQCFGDFARFGNWLIFYYGFTFTIGKKLDRFTFKYHRDGNRLNFTFHTCYWQVQWTGHKVFLFGMHFPSRFDFEKSKGRKDPNRPEQYESRH